MKTRHQRKKILPSKIQTDSQTDFQAASSHLTYQQDLQQQTLQDNSNLTQTLSVAYNPAQIKCRDQEKQKISKFIKDCLATNGEGKSRVLYISGVPGVGKTVATMEIIKNLKKTINSKKAIFKYINTMNCKAPQGVYKLMNIQLFRVQKNDLGTKNIPLSLQAKLEKDKRIKFLVIDEVDFLINRSQSILYNIFEWSNIPTTRLCLIVIANTMDFPQRLMQKISSRMGENRLVFRPYSQKQVQLIIEQRLGKSDRFSKDAIIYSCKKMSSFTSDVRKILHILQLALEENKSLKKIEINEIVKHWRFISEQNGQTWQEQLPQCYRNILAIVKQLGGRCFDYQLVERLESKYNFCQKQIIDICKTLAETSLVKMSEKQYKCQILYQITLLKI